jgi:hypothetical protein
LFNLKIVKKKQVSLQIKKKDTLKFKLLKVIKGDLLQEDKKRSISLLDSLKEFDIKILALLKLESKGFVPFGWGKKLVYSKLERETVFYRIVKLSQILKTSFNPKNSLDVLNFLFQESFLLRSPIEEKKEKLGLLLFHSLENQGSEKKNLFSIQKGFVGKLNFRKSFQKYLVAKSIEKKKNNESKQKLKRVKPIRFFHSKMLGSSHKQKPKKKKENRKK